MSVTFNLKNQQDYRDFYDEVIYDLEENNSKDDKDYPLDENGKRITVDYLWEEFGSELDGTQTGLGYQVFNEIIEYYNEFTADIELTAARRKEIIDMAREDYLDAYECGHINPEDDCNRKLLRECGLNTKVEQDVYIDKYMELCN